MRVQEKQASKSVNKHKAIRTERQLSCSLASLKVPTGQAMHVVALCWSWYVPSGQSWHSVLRTRFSNLPSEHGVHSAERMASAKKPLGQSLHAEETSIEKVPTGQLAHVVEFISEENVPALQSWHAD